LSGGFCKKGVGMKIPYYILLGLTVTACGGGGGGHSGPAGSPGTPNKSEYEIWLEQGNAGTEQDFIAYQAWLSQGNTGSYKDFVAIMGPTKPIFSLEENKFDNMSLTALGSRSYANSEFKVNIDDKGQITSIDLVDMHDPDHVRYHEMSLGDEPGTRYHLTADGDKYNSQTIYYYDLPYKSTACGGEICGFGFRTEKELSLAEVKETFERALNSLPDWYNLPDDAIAEITGYVDALTEDDIKTTPVCYDTKCEYTESELGQLFVSPQSLTMDVEAFGRDVGLSYSNFGELRGTYNLGDGTIPRAYVFAGGNTQNRIDKQSINEEMTFSGKAVGQVLYHYAYNDTLDQSYMDVAADAHLTFADGKEELTMNFSENADPNKRWYDVKITTNNDADYENATAILSNGDKIADINAKYKMSDPNPSARLDVEYYGKDGAPTEAVGKAFIRQQNWGGGPHDTPFWNHEVSLFSAFGATKDK